MIGFLLQATAETAGDLSPFIDAFVGFFYTIGVIGGGLALLMVWIALIGKTFHAHDLGPPLAGVVFFVPTFALLYATGLWRYIVVQHLSAFATAAYVLGTVGYLGLLWLESRSDDGSDKELPGGDAV